MSHAGIRLFRALALLIVFGFTASCESLQTGPSLSNVVLSAFTKEPTTDQRDSSLCCCRAVGTATNRNIVPIYLSINFSAVDLRGAIISSALYFSPDIPPGQTAAIDAPGFIFPCNAISHFNAEVKVRGLTEPPQ